MALYINVPDSANAEQSVTLSGTLYNFKFSYNSRDERYRLSIYLGDTSIVEGMKLVETNSPTLKYTLPDFDHGELFVIRIEDTDEQVNRNNIGADKPYRLVYLTNEELAAL